MKIAGATSLVLGIPAFQVYRATHPKSAFTDKVKFMSATEPLIGYISGADYLNQVNLDVPQQYVSYNHRPVPTSSIYKYLNESKADYLYINVDDVEVYGLENYINSKTTYRHFDFLGNIADFTRDILIKGIDSHTDTHSFYNRYIRVLCVLTGRFDFFKPRYPVVLVHSNEQLRGDHPVSSLLEQLNGQVHIVVVRNERHKRQ